MNSAGCIYAESNCYNLMVVTNNAACQMITSTCCTH